MKISRSSPNKAFPFLRQNAITIFMLSLALCAHAQTYTVLHNFSGSDGSSPDAALIRDSAGNLYGATTYAGTGSCAQTQACGTFYKLAANGKLSVIQDFNGPNGSTP